LAVAAILMGLGMMMLSPPVVSLPVKLLLFVMVDGWAMLCGGVVASFR
jgi:flagellar biosynthesis protein FliP